MLETLKKHLLDCEKHAATLRPTSRNYFKLKKEAMELIELNNYRLDRHAFLMNWCIFGSQGLCATHKWYWDEYGKNKLKWNHYCKALDQAPPTSPENEI